MTHVTDIRVPGAATVVSRLPAGLDRLVFSLFSTLRFWYERSRQRRRLARLGDNLLRDIGVDRMTAMEEASKPFWQD